MFAHNLYLLYLLDMFASYTIRKIRPSVLSRCWFGVGKSIWPVIIEWWRAGRLCVKSKMQIVCRFSWCHCHPKTPWSLSSFKCRLILPFWYRLIQDDLEKRLLNGCSSSSSSYTIKKYSKQQRETWSSAVHYWFSSWQRYAILTEIKFYSSAGNSQLKTDNVTSSLTPETRLFSQTCAAANMPEHHTPECKHHILWHSN